MDDEEIHYSHTNAIKYSDLFLFDTIDPQISIDFEGKKVSKVSISGEIYLISSGDTALLSKRFQNSKSWFVTKFLIL